MVKSGELGNSLPLVFRDKKLHVTHPPHREPKQKYAHLNIFFEKKKIFFWIFISLDPADSKRSIAGSDDQKYASHISECKI